MKLARKLTIATIMGGKSAVLDAALSGRIMAPDPETGKMVIAPMGRLVPMCRIIGQVNGIKAGDSDTGPFVKLMGLFEGTNLITGEVVPDVGVCILPNFVSNGIASAIAGGAVNVQFAVEIDVQYVASAATSYAFEARSLIEQESAGLSALKASLIAQGVALPAPRAQAALPGAPAPTAAPTPAPTEAPKAKARPAPTPAPKRRR